MRAPLVEESFKNFENGIERLLISSKKRMTWALGRTGILFFELRGEYSFFSIRALRPIIRKRLLWTSGVLRGGLGKLTKLLTRDSKLAYDELVSGASNEASL